MSDQRDVLNDLNELAGLQPDAAAAQLAIERAKAALTAMPPSPTRPSKSNFGAKLMRPRNLAAIAAAALFMVLCTQWLPTSTGGGFAFAQVQAQVAKSKSVQYKQVWTEKTKDGKVHLQLTSTVQILGDRLKREDISSNGVGTGPFGRHIQIRNLIKGQELGLWPDIKAFVLGDAPPALADAYIDPEMDAKSDKNGRKKSADPKSANDKSWDVNGEITTADWGKLKPEPRLDMFALLQHVPSENVKRLPEKSIDGKKAVGFLVEQDETNRFGTTHWRHTWWVDPNTKLPIRMEVTFHSDDPRSGLDERVISDIVFDAPLEQSLFSIDPPKDYRRLDLVAQEMFQPKASGPARKKTEFVFVDVQEEVAKTKSVQYTAVTNRSIGKNPVPEMITKTMILGPHLKRDELTLKDPTKLEEARKWGVEPNINIHNVKTGELLSLYPEMKMFAGPQNMGFVYKAKENEQPSKKEIDAAKAQSDKWLKDPQVDFYDEIRSFPESKATKLPEKTIGGKHVVGFLLDLGKSDPTHKVVASITYWIDTETKLPVQIVHVNHTDAEMGLNQDTVIRDIVFDAPLDESLFSFTPPKDYTEMGKAVAGGATPNADGPAGKKTEFVFAEAEDAVAKANTMQYTEIRKNRTTDGKNGPETTTRVMIMGDSLQRREVTTKAGDKLQDGQMWVDKLGKSIDIYNAKLGKLVVVDPDKKSFSVIRETMSIGNDGKVETHAIQPDPKANLCKMIREIPADPTKKLPEQMVDGKKAIGFVVDEKSESPHGVDTFHRTYWFDPKTKLPIRMDVTFRSTNPTRAESDWVLKDFVFDAPLDESLFSTDPPKGYSDMSQQPAKKDEGKSK